jgi:hypothetical protein
LSGSELLPWLHDQTAAFVISAKLLLPLVAHRFETVASIKVFFLTFT